MVERSELVLRYIIIFFIFSILGWAYERIAFGRLKPDLVSEKIFDMRLPILPIYGFGGVILLFIYDTFTDYSLLTKVIVAAISLTIMELIGGYLSYNIHGYQTWKYTDSMIPAFDGYISVYATAIWVIGSTIFFYTLDKMKEKNLIL
ncbi:MAG: hypothetical protein Barrevirus6_29 [Barrevirus sp.]|uniref:Uncharacterized protein n=1 Tax=Barrevirus sp. TaxID=2487763 RepID=A0A3G4ZSL5_9VIRU|nr:MAG: hypothetical protein Barrevirus6_29 [Barrevirus sp.]